MTAGSEEEPEESQDPAEDEGELNGDDAEDGEEVRPTGVLATVGVSLASAAVGAVGGMLLARSVARRAARVPKMTLELKGLAGEVGEAGRQFNRLAREVIAVGAAAERVGRSLSRD